MNFYSSKRFKGKTVNGITNYGNTCYLNSFLQFCYHSILFNIITEYSDSNSFVNSLKEILNLYLGNFVIEKVLIQKFILKCDFQLNVQYDIYDIILKLLNLLNNEEYIIRYNTHLKCQNCNLLKSKSHSLNIINISNNNINLEEGIKKCFQEETVMLDCSKCSNDKFTQCYVDVSLPDSLIIHIMKGDSKTMRYELLLNIFGYTYSLINSVSRIGYNVNNGHFYNIIIMNNIYTKVSDDVISEMDDFFDYNTVILLYKKQIIENNPNTDNHNTILIDRSINRLQCPSCNKLISIKHISEHQQVIHANFDFSLRDYNKIDTKLSKYRKANKIEKLILDNDVNLSMKYSGLESSMKRESIISSENGTKNISIDNVNPNVYKSDNEINVTNSINECRHHNKFIKEGLYSNPDNGNIQDVKDYDNHSSSINSINGEDENILKTSYLESGYITNEYVAISKNIMDNNGILMDYSNEENIDTVDYALQRDSPCESVTIIDNIANEPFDMKMECSDTINSLMLDVTSKYEKKFNSGKHILNGSDCFYTQSAKDIKLQNLENNNNVDLMLTYNDLKDNKIYCAECDKNLSAKNIRQHYSRYHKEKLLEYPNKCGINGCLLTYPTKAGLSYHQKKHHIVEYLNSNFKSFQANNFNISTTDNDKIRDNQEKNIHNERVKKVKCKSIKQILFEYTGLSYIQFVHGSAKPINIYDSTPVFVSNRKIVLPNKQSKDKVFRSVSIDLIHKYGKDVGLLPTNQLNGIHVSKLNKKLKINLNNLINGIMKDIVILIHKYYNKYNKTTNNTKQNNIKFTAGNLIKSLATNDYYTFNFNVKHILNSNERILLLKELNSNDLNLDDVKSWNESEKRKCMYILNRLSKYEKNKNNSLDGETLSTRKLFEENPKMCVNNILSDTKESKCNIRNNVIFEYYRKNFSNSGYKSINNRKELPTWWNKIIDTLPSEDNGTLIPDFDFIKEDEFNTLLANLKTNSSPGPDGINYKILKNCESVRIIFRKILNMCLYYNFIPDCFKTSHMILLDKNKDNKMDLSNWRPICLSNIISKILTKWISNKLYEINDLLKMEDKCLFSEEQRGFKYNINGCEDHSNILKIIYEDSKRDKPKNTHSISNVSIDFKDAFTSVPHYIIHTVLDSFHIPPTIKNIIIEYYNNSHLYIKNNGDIINKKIYIDKGVKQGDPLSPLLFNLLLEPLIRLIKSSNIGYKFKNDSQLQLGVMAYADDVVLLTNNINEMESLLILLESYCI